MLDQGNFFKCPFLVRTKLKRSESHNHITDNLVYLSTKTFTSRLYHQMLPEKGKLNVFQLAILPRQIARLMYFHNY